MSKEVDHPVKKRVSLAEAAQIALRILIHAEEARSRVAEVEAMTGVQWKDEG